ncbi:uncharacterized protein LOC127241066 [Andrographis paniculata]|uniref:uncharacterized protein LOC127241066 n=1 Tax=Andrographis paniculata TaxID=175694 RepID=UPI0021E8B7AC|nr:uncharacterized protein LOC127241066 [Andrographis paniculata]XP_051115914.1 uncharacterized protein LOC127241066 [Andrographis paniculata]
MDVWVFAAAAGAGYVAQKLKNLRFNKSNSCSVSGKKCSFDLFDSSRAAMAAQESVEGHKKLSCNDASNSGAERDSMAMVVDSMFRGVVYDPNSSKGRNVEDSDKGDWEDRVAFDAGEVLTGDTATQSSSRDVGFYYGFKRGRSSRKFGGIRSKFMKPRNSLESCVMAQFYREYAKFEECICSVHPPEKPISNPFCVSDGSKVIRRMPCESCSMTRETIKPEVCNDTCPEGDELVVGIPKLPPVKLSQRGKAKVGTEQVLMERRNVKLATGNRSNEQDGLSDGTLQFYVGLTMGILYSFWGSKWEIEKLKKSLAQTESLIQDLHEELEMKDALTVKELAVEDHESPNAQNDSHVDDAGQPASSLEEKQDNSSRNCNADKVADEESLRKIEAELEAELDMLETNMNSSRFKGQMSSLAKLDPNFVSNVIEGEFRADLFGVKVGAQVYADRDGSNRSTPRYDQYPVSPRELSLRLHEVIQSRLEERVRELEAALEHSRHKKLECSPESDRTHSSEHEIAAASRDFDQPVIINLSRGTPAAYNDAYEDEEEMCPFSGGGRGAEMRRNSEEELPTATTAAAAAIEQCSSGEEDEMEKMLIRQIVEKARKGSPAVINARRALLSAEF